MARKEHLAILEQGVDKWNRWRQVDPSQPVGSVTSDLRWPDLSGVALQEKILSGANLSNTDLSEASLAGADLRRADFTEADLTGANLTGADLRQAILRHATLTRANLYGANLDGTELAFANLTGTNLSRSNIREADFMQAQFWGTIFGDLDLHLARHLEEALHGGPSMLGVQTLLRSEGKIPVAFLRGCGVPQSLIDYLPSLAGSANEFYSCFISYSSKDDAFARKLYRDLQDKGVLCWFAPEDLRIGDRIRIALDNAISLQEKLLLILSKDSVESHWVEQEVEKAFERERRESITMLFPIRLDDTVFSIGAGWASHLKRTRHIGDFSSWQDEADYQRAFERLLRDLKAS